MDNWTLWYITAQSVRVVNEESATFHSEQRNDVIVPIEPRDVVGSYQETDVTRRVVRERKFDMSMLGSDSAYSSSKVYVSK